MKKLTTIATAGILLLTSASPALSADYKEFDPNPVMDCVEHAQRARSCQGQIIQPCSGLRGDRNPYRYGECLGALIIKWRSISAERANAARFKMPLSDYKAAERAVNAYKSDGKAQCEKDAAQLNSEAKTESLKKCELLVHVTAAVAMRNPELIAGEIEAGRQQSQPSTQSRWKKAKN